MSTPLVERLPPDSPGHEPERADDPGRAGPGRPASPSGAGEQPRWARRALWGLLLLTAVLYLWGLGASGDANSFYAAATWAGTRSWKALFFASLDPGNAITVDKPPASLWVMALSGRIFGFSSWSMLVPQALQGVLSVALLHAAVRRWSGPVAGLIAGFALAVTPVAALMFRFNNPDAMLVLLMLLACWATVRAVESGRARWVVLAGAAVGFAFLAKMMQGYVIVPALALVYLWAAPVSLAKRFLHLLWGGLSIAVSTGWFVLAVALWPASSRPFIGGSTNNSEWQLAVGYNGLGRIFGGDGNPGGGGPGGPGGGPPGGPGGGAFGGSTGVTRMFGSAFGGEVAWLLPTALIALVALLFLTRRASRTDRIRAAALLWGGWLLVNGVLFSFMSGIIHPYYTVAIAPPIGALVGIGAVELWHRRDVPWARVVLALMTAAAAAWAFLLLGRNSSWLPWLRWALLVAAVGGAAALAAATRARQAVTVAAVAASLVGALGGSTAWAVATASQPHGGPIPASGPGGAGAPGGFGGPPGTWPGSPPVPGQGAGDADGGPGGGGVFGPGGPGSGDVGPALVGLLKETDNRWAAATVGAQQAGSLQLASRRAVMAMGGFSGGDNSPTLEEFRRYVARGEIHYLVAGGRGPGSGTGPAGPAGAGGRSGSGAPGVPGGGDGAPPGTGTPGGTGGSGPGPGGAAGGAPGAPGDGFPGAPGGAGGAAPGGFPGGRPGGVFGGSGNNQIGRIEAWVEEHYAKVTVDTRTVYDLTRPKS
ncbi:glycosyltransferase family 39 protein [Kitasatospora sp. NPDC056327]|uniref:glycosyltransferase family 39 protein n=1 Tax=Kitasatospora sp. NPDC056327 TaxID=3345785 RepID=UPI0035DD71C6